jgi:hypothetical protein
MTDRLFMILVALAFFALAAVCGFVSNRRKSRIAASATWPSVVGAVLSNAIKIIRNGKYGGGVETYSVSLRYRYAVGSADYESSRIGWGTKYADVKPDIPEAFLRDHPAGQAIDVFYDPTNPAMAMVDPTGKRFGLIHVNMTLFMAWTLSLCGLLALGASALF